MLHFSPDILGTSTADCAARQRSASSARRYDVVLDLRRLDHVLVAAYVAALAIWGGSRILSLFLASADVNPAAFAFSARLGIALSGLALFAWVTYVTGLWRNVWSAGLLLLGSSFYVLLLSLLITGNWLHDQKTAAGHYLGSQADSFGFLFMSVVLVLYFVALSLLWTRLRKKANETSIIGEYPASGSWSYPRHD